MNIIVKKLIFVSIALIQIGCNQMKQEKLEILQTIINDDYINSEEQKAVITYYGDKSNPYNKPLIVALDINIKYDSILIDKYLYRRFRIDTLKKFSFDTTSIDIQDLKHCILLKYPFSEDVIEKYWYRDRPIKIRKFDTSLINKSEDQDIQFSPQSLDKEINYDTNYYLAGYILLKGMYFTKDKKYAIVDIEIGRWDTQLKGAARQIIYYLRKENGIWKIVNDMLGWTT